MWSSDKNLSGRGFLTPQPPAWKKTQFTTVLPLSERKRISPENNGDFHVIHKVPASDSPYGRAKHVQLIDKDPNKAVSMFWAAINAGDRVDSALKDMAVVMKQLNRTDEAIDNESLDNVLIELYKRSGRVDEEIEILQNKLRNSEEGTVFGGKKTKIARSQGKKIQITIEQEKSRILGNLAWAYLQQHNYGIAEQHYRKALSLESDKNKQCNLAICLMHMNRISEAKSLLQDVKASAGTEEMDESYLKSYERAMEMLAQVESQKLAFSFPKMKTIYLGVWTREDCLMQMSKTVNHTVDIMTQVHMHTNWTERVKLKESCRKNSEVLLTQPRRCYWGFNTPDQRRGGRWGEDTVRNSIRKLCFEQTVTTESVPSTSIQNLKEEPPSSSNVKPKNSAVGQEEGEEAQEGLFTQPRNSSSWLNNRDQRRRKSAEESIDYSFSKQSNGVTTHPVQSLNVEPSVSSKDEPEIELEKQANAAPNKKTWADMVEEDEKEEFQCGRKYLGKSSDDGFNKDDDKFGDENLNSNIIYQYAVHSKHHIESITQSAGMTGGYNASPSTVSSRRNRLQEDGFGEMMEELIKLCKVEKKKPISSVLKGVKEAQSTTLEKPFTEEEIWEAIANSDINKAPGPDGLNLGYFKKFWPSLKEVMLLFFKEFYEGKEWDIELNLAKSRIFGINVEEEVLGSLAKEIFNGIFPSEYLGLSSGAKRN
ncbi:Protein POLLENLESS 3-LIKE 2 [Hibiscus syriacus]|uniref:Protein POLLENLESS 3-LIKE 2 n=1 Tax=Hibiscus syriacus TaxID=106335 RepID=A0A6A3C4A5_HIBSY|nr:Protein POLLENLESS 3-LIKE 2 [Hibiscus syriacus]